MQPTRLTRLTLSDGVSDQPKGLPSDFTSARPHLAV